MTNNTSASASSADTALRLPAEWEPQGAVLLAWPHRLTDWQYMLAEAQDCFARVIEAIAEFAPVILVGPDVADARRRLHRLASEGRIAFVNIPTNDTWARDFGPITAIDADGSSVICDFTFNGWGRKFEAALDNDITAALIADGIITGRHRRIDDFVLEGGSIESDGRGTLLTTARCLLSTNRNEPMTRADIDSRLARELGFTRSLWLTAGELLGDDTDAHIDTLARFAPDDTIVYVGCDRPDDPHYAPLQLMKRDLQAFTTATGRPYRLIELPLPMPVLDPDDGHRLPATYANFLIINGAVIMSTYGQPVLDAIAADRLAVAFPGYAIRCVDCRALVRQHGSLHCITMQIPKNILP